MAQTVPPLHIFGIKGFLELADDEVVGLLSALELASPQFNSEELTKVLSGSVDIPNPLLNSIVALLVTIYRTLSEAEPNGRSRDENAARLLDRRIYPALRRSEAFSPDKQEEEWPKLRAFLLTALSFDRSLGTTAKAGPVLTEHERIFDDVKIMTDLRPIYHLDVAEKPDGLLVIHMLRITERNRRGDEKDSVFALDTNDLAKLKRSIERAEIKEQTLRNMLEGSTASIINVKADY